MQRRKSRETSRTYILTLPAYDTKEKAYRAFSEKVVELCKAIDTGRNFFDNFNSYDGQSGHLKVMYAWWMQNEAAQVSIYNCFYKHLPKPSAWDKFWSILIPQFPTRY